MPTRLSRSPGCAESRTTPRRRAGESYDSRIGRLTVHVSAGAERSELVGRHGDGWRVRVAARPERGRANAALAALLSALLGVSRDRVAVVAGRTSRRKLVEVDGLDDEELARRLDRGAGS